MRFRAAPRNEDAGLLAQQIQVGYSQQVNRFYEIGTNNVYMVRGRAEGQMSMSRVSEAP